MRSTIAAAVAAVICLGLSARATADPVSVVSEAAVTEPLVTRLVLHSARLGRDFEVSVQKPYATVFLPNQRLPAIYALDGGHGIAGRLGLLLGPGSMSPAFIVSVGYLPGQGSLRLTDLAHNPSMQEGKLLGGGGAAFEAFLLEDLKPFLESRYPIDADTSVLFGHSLGALFAVNLLADKPEAFAGYILGSVPVSWDPGVVERASRAASLVSGKRIFLAVAEGEDATTGYPLWRMQEGFSSMQHAFRNRKGVNLKTKVYSPATHSSYYPQIILDGFPFVLPPRRPVNAPVPAVLPADERTFSVGVYKMPDGRKISVKMTDERFLSGQVTGLEPVILLPNGKHRFYVPSSDLDVLFDEGGLTLTGQGGAKLRADREQR